MYIYILEVGDGGEGQWIFMGKERARFEVKIEKKVGLLI